jgi:hypothetical protein
MIEKLLNKAKLLQGNISIVIALFTSTVFIYNSYIKDNPIAVYIHNQKVIREALAAEGDLDKVVFKRYHLELYHANKNAKGQIKFSYLNYNGKLYKCWIDPSSGYWVYKNGHDVNYIKELAH